MKKSLKVKIKKASLALSTSVANYLSGDYKCKFDVNQKLRWGEICVENFIPLMNGASPGLVVKQNGEIGQTRTALAAKPVTF